MRLRFLAFLLALLVSYPLPVVADDCYFVRVLVDETRPNGQGWDANNGMPDLKVCLYDNWGERCKSRGERTNYNRPYCEDSLACDLGVIEFHEPTVYLKITDLDLHRHDAVDAGECVVGKQCELGSAVIQFHPASCA